MERYSTVWAPSLPPSDGAGMVSEVPLVHVAPPSVLYSVTATPLPASLPLKPSVTSPSCQAPSAPLTLVAGAPPSILTVQLLAGLSVWPAASVER